MTAETTARPLPAAASPREVSPIQAHRVAIHAVDAVVVALTVALVLALGFGAGAPLAQDGPRQALSVALLVIWPLMLWQRQSSARLVLGQGMEEYRRVLVASAWTLLLVAAASYFFAIERARWFTSSAILIGTFGLLVGRHLMRLRLHRVMGQGHPLHRVFVIAAPAWAQEICQTLAAKDHRYLQVGAQHLLGAGDPEPGAIVRQALAVRADTILYAPLGTDHTQWTRRLGWAMEESDLSLLVSPSLVEIAGPRMSVEPVEGLAFVRVDMPRFSGPARVVKRGLDIFGASAGLLLLGLPMLVIGWLIRRDSPGPAIFKQTRAGVRSGTFQCWKFRTMHLGADGERAALRAAAEASATDSAGRATFKLVYDPRVTRTGVWLRRWSIDELPQLVNVLKGEMSLVGPRPHPLDDVERYDAVATRRLLAKPGMTGLWQVSGRSDLDWEQAVRLDLNYVENWSMAADLLILLRTAKVVVAGSGAY